MSAYGGSILADARRVIVRYGTWLVEEVRLVYYRLSNATGLESRKGKCEGLAGLLRGMVGPRGVRVMGCHSWVLVFTREDIYNSYYESRIYIALLPANIKNHLRSR